MTFPTGQVIPTTNLDSASDSPASARADLLQTVETVNTIVADANSADGVLVLDGSGLIPSGVFPTYQTPNGTLTLAPTDGVVKINNVLRLQTLNTTQVLALSAAIGDIAYCTDAVSGSTAGLCVYDGTNWKIIDLDALSNLS
jgi:hypothetical protein